MQIRKNRSALLLLVFVLFGIYCFVLGDSGILERIKLTERKDKVRENISRLVRENDKLKKDHSVISNSRTNRSFYKNEASKSGYIAPGEKYLFFKNTGEYNVKENGININAANDNKKYTVEISHLRILWIFASIMVMLLYFWKRNKEKEDAV